MNKPIRIYLHQFLVDDYSWIFILQDQLKLIEDTGLEDAMENIYLTVIGNAEQLKIFKKLNIPRGIIEYLEVSTTEEDIQKEFAQPNPIHNFQGENYTLHKLWEDSQEKDFNALYLHAKGLTSFSRHFKQGDVDTFENYFHWRKYLEWGCIEHWKTCTDSLFTHDTAGCNFNADPFPHYSGNIWWVRSEYLRTLEDINSCSWWNRVRMPYHTDRLLDEMWVCHNTKKSFNLHSPPGELCSPNPGLYLTKYARNLYDRNTPKGLGL